MKKQTINKAARKELHSIKYLPESLETRFPFLSYASWIDKLAEVPPDAFYPNTEPSTTPMKSASSTTDSSTLLSTEIHRRHIDLRSGMVHRIGPNRPIPDGVGKPRYESLYQPYWEKGDLVYYRNTSTKYPQTNILNIGDDKEHNECNQICPQIYLDYGPVCAMRMIKWHFEYTYRDFENMCQLELENCKSLRKPWYPIRRGKCKPVDVTLSPRMENIIVDRVKQWEKRYSDNIEAYVTDHLRPSTFSPHY